MFIKNRKKVEMYTNGRLVHRNISLRIKNIFRLPAVLKIISYILYIITLKKARKKRQKD